MNRLNRLGRLVGLAGTTAALVTSLTAGTALAAGSPTVGHVYVNNNSAGANTVAGFDRHADGSLSPIAGSPFAAGGAGTGAPYGSAGGLQEIFGRSLPARHRPRQQRDLGPPDQAERLPPDRGRRAVQRHLAGQHRGPRQPRLRRQRRSGGSNYTGFRLNAGGHLRPISGSTYDLPGRRPARPRPDQPRRPTARRDPRRPERRTVVHRRVPDRLATVG